MTEERRHLWLSVLFTLLALHSHLKEIRYCPMKVSQNGSPRHLTEWVTLLFVTQHINQQVKLQMASLLLYIVVWEVRWTKVILEEEIKGLCSYLVKCTITTSLRTSHVAFPEWLRCPHSNFCPRCLESSPATSLWDLNLRSNCTSLGYYIGPQDWVQFSSRVGTELSISPSQPSSQLSCYLYSNLICVSSLNTL